MSYTLINVIFSTTILLTGYTAMLFSIMGFFIEVLSSNWGFFISAGIWLLPLASINWQLLGLFSFSQSGLFVSLLMDYLIPLFHNCPLYQGQFHVVAFYITCIIIISCVLWLMIECHMSKLYYTYLCTRISLSSRVVYSSI